MQRELLIRIALPPLGALLTGPAVGLSLLGALPGELAADLRALHPAFLVLCVGFLIAAYMEICHPTPSSRLVASPAQRRRLSALFWCVVALLGVLLGLAFLGSG